MSSSVIAGGHSEKIKFSNGKVKYEKIHLTGQLVKIVSYYSTGQVKEIGHYKNGVRHGSFVNYTKKGTRISTAFFYADKKEGLWSFYNSTGEIERHVFFNKNKILKLDEYRVTVNSEFK